MHDEQALIVTFDLEHELPSVAERTAVSELESRLNAALSEEPKFGEWDGREYRNNQIVIYLYGSDAEVMFNRLRQVLATSGFSDGIAELRFGEPGAPSRTVRLRQANS